MPEPFVASPTSAPAAPEGDEDFSFSFADVATDAPAAAPHAEAEDDLWSEVSLRDRPAAGIADAALEDEGLWGASPAAGQSSVEDMFEEVTTARIPGVIEPPVPLREEVFPPPPPAAVPPPAAGPAATAPPAVALDQETLERAVTAAVQQALKPLVGDLAKRLVEEIAWEVVPDLAEAMIRAEIERVSRAADTG